jgi:hypothetical protein
MQGPLDSMVSDRRGRFHFSVRADTAALYLVSGRYAGIEYFSLPLSPSPVRSDTGVVVLVYDTSSTAPVRLAARHLVVTRPDEDGLRSVLDLIVLENGGRLTRVAPDPVHPSWSGPLPKGTVGLEVGESDVSAAAVERRDDSILVSAPLSPGEKQLTIQYQVPPRKSVIEIPVSRPGVSLNVLAEEPEILVQGSGLVLADSQVIQGRSFRRWTGTTAASGTIRIALPASSPTPKWILLTLVSALALALVSAGAYLVSHPARLERPSSEDLLNAIAALDVRYQGREQELSSEEWSSYQRERARLKTELEASLAAGGRSR